MEEKPLGVCSSPPVYNQNFQGGGVVDGEGVAVKDT